MATRKSTVKKKTTKKAAKKTMQYADGRDESNESLAQTVESLMSVRKKDPFKLSSGENFADAIGGLTLSQLQEIAVEAGVFPSGTKTTLKNKLLKEYENITHGRYGASSRTETVVDPKSEKAKEILKIINE